MSIDRDTLGDLLRQTYVKVLEEPLPARLKKALRDIMRKKDER